MRTAKEWGVRPLTILRGETGREWTRVDAILATAHTYAQDLLCRDCGQPIHEAYNPDSEGWYVVKDSTCNGCLAVARDGDIHKDHQIERKIHVVDERPPDQPLAPWRP